MVLAISMIDDKLIGMTTAHEIYKIIMVKLKALWMTLMCDRASVNDVAMDQLSGDFQCSEDKVLFPHP
jgi:hypothetical protein